MADITLTMTLPDIEAEALAILVATRASRYAFAPGSNVGERFVLKRGEHHEWRVTRVRELWNRLRDSIAVEIGTVIGVVEKILSSMWLWFEYVE